MYLGSSISEATISVSRPFTVVSVGDLIAPGRYIPCIKWRVITLSINNLGDYALMIAVPGA